MALPGFTRYSFRSWPTSAASILFAAMGVCVALSQLVLDVGVTALVLITLRGLGFVEQLLEGRRR